MQILILLILVLIYNPSSAYEEQELIPIARSNSNSYPVLDELEALIYPKYKFTDGNPGERLERLEVAVFGSKQEGSVKSRILRMQSETRNWQIAEMQTRKSQILNRPQETPRVVYVHQPKLPNPPQRKDYDYMNYRLMTPLIQNIGREGIRQMFRRHK